MIRKWFAVGVIFLFIGMNSLPSIGGILKEKATITTRGSRGYIQGLIDNASNGDTIYIPSALYDENIIINKSISLIGEDKNFTIINGNKIGNVVNITADLVTLSGFTIQNSGTFLDDAGIRLQTNYTTITNTIICNNNHGITGGFHSKGYNHCKIADNIITNNRGSIQLYKHSNDNTISGNTIAYNGYGLKNYYSDNNTFTENIIWNNGWEGIYSIGEHIVIIDNIIFNNGFGITITNKDVMTEKTTNNIDAISSPIQGDFYSIVGNTISSSRRGIYIDECHNNIISGNIIDHHNGSGIDLYRSSNNYITDNTITSNGQMGITLSYYCTNTTINGNVISINRCGITLYSSNYNIVSNNTISSNHEDGITLQNSNFSSIRNNTIYGNNYYGIILEMGASNNTLTRNILYSNRWGLSLDLFCNNNTITNNEISQNAGGIFLLDCSNNIIKRNNLLENELSAFFIDFYENSHNTWEQNFWNKPRVLPKVIVGITIKNPLFLIPLPRIEIDRFPASEPYHGGGI